MEITYDRIIKETLFLLQGLRIEKQLELIRMKQFSWTLVISNTQQMLLLYKLTVCKRDFGL